MSDDWRFKYNTQLKADDEVAFQRWAYANHRIDDLLDYDLRGYWAATHGNPPTQGHFPDTFKKPNHPTFSTESQYHGASGDNGEIYQGGTWGKGEYTPSGTNQQFFPPEELLRYFQAHEPGVKLKL